MRFALIALMPLVASPALAQSTGSMPAMTAEQHAAMSGQAAGAAQGSGQIKSVDAKAGTVTIHHNPIPALGWPAMTMTFKATPEALKAAKAGQTVAFSVNPQTNEVVAIQPK